MDLNVFDFDISELTPLEIGVVYSLNALNKLGTSKKVTRIEYNYQRRSEAKAHGMNNDDITKMHWCESPYIHGLSTLRQYMDEGRRFARWLQATHPDVTKIKYASKKGYAYEYIQQMIDLHMSPSTIAKRTSALAKLYRVSANEIHNNRPARINSEFTRSRSYNKDRYEKDIQKYGVIPEICRITGVRECELERLTPECFFEDANGDIGLHLDGREQNTKGGRTRNVVIIGENQARMKYILRQLVPG